MQYIYIYFMLLDLMEYLSNISNKTREKKIASIYFNNKKINFESENIEKQKKSRRKEEKEEKEASIWIRQRFASLM